MTPPDPFPSGHDREVPQIRLCRRLLRTLGRQARLTRILAELEAENGRLRGRVLELERQAATDPLTGLLNRRGIEEVLTHEVGRRTRYADPLAVGLVDADRFKEVNDRFLHPGGDAALAAIAPALSGTLRASDWVGRFGGEEFLVVAPHTDLAGAAALGERLRAAVEGAVIRYNGEVIPVTVSIGFGVAPAGLLADAAMLRHAAAGALREAKRAGRNHCAVRAVTGLEVCDVGGPSDSG